MYTTRSHKLRLCLLRDKVSFLVCDSDMKVAEAATKVSDDEKENRRLCMRDRFGEPVSELGQARLSYDPDYDFAIRRQLPPPEPSKKFANNWRAAITSGLDSNNHQAPAPAHPKRLCLRSARTP